MNSKSSHDRAKKRFAERYGELTELKRVRSFICKIAAMTQDGEVVYGEEFCMENDDAVSTVNRLIEEARGILRKAKS